MTHTQIVFLTNPDMKNSIYSLLILGISQIVMKIVTTYLWGFIKQSFFLDLLTSPHISTYI